MYENHEKEAKRDYIAPAVLRLGSSAELTAAGSEINSDDAINADNAYPNPATAS